MKNNSKVQNIFFTICAKNFLAHSRVLYNSIKRFYPDCIFYVVLCDKLDGYLDVSLEPFEFIFIEDLDIDDFDVMSDRYNITELNTAVKPFAFLYLMEKCGFESVIYVDPDLLFIDRLVEVDDLIKNGAEAVLTPHILKPAENTELDDRKFLLFGIYNLGFLALTKTVDVINFLQWWSRKLKNECTINLSEGIFVDQKWCDLLPAFVAGTKILNHSGYNVAYWNLPQRKISKINEQWFSNDLPLRFVHFSGNNIDDMNVFSRHSTQVTIENIGDLKQILDYYRKQVYANKHEFYRKLPYAYSWNGETGKNLHTPDSLNMAVISQSETCIIESPLLADQTKFSLKFKIERVLNALPVAKKLSGGSIALARRGWRSYKAHGFQHVKNKIVDLSSYSNKPLVNYSAYSSTNQAKIDKKLLYLDWGLPKPDHDAASIYTFLLLKIFIEDGCSVTFLPCSLQYEENYFENLVKEGVDVKCYPEVTSVDSWLDDNIDKFDICVLTRGPVVWPYLDKIRRLAPELTLIFNTIDLHYLREIRQADIENNSKLKESALVTKEQEFDLISKCDITFLISSHEAYTVREVLPNAKIIVLPLIYDEIPGANANKTFASRKNIIFIGSFPHMPNIDAILYYVKEIHPIVKKLIPDIKLKIIGGNPPTAIKNLANDNTIEVLGFVKSLKPIYDESKLTIAPLRFGAGIKGKIANSMCYGVPSVATKIAAEGMNLSNNHNILIADKPEDFASAIHKLYSDENMWINISNNGYKYALENYSYEVIKNKVCNILHSVENGWVSLDNMYEIDSWDSYLVHEKNCKSIIIDRILKEQELLPANDSPSFVTTGVCGVCKCSVNYLTSYMYTTGKAPNGKDMPNWREHMQCSKCGLVNRVRASLHILHTLSPPHKNSRIYITERITKTYDWLNHKYENLIGSEYLGPNLRPGEVINNIRHENVMDLSFENNSLDYVLSFDVLEHVPNCLEAFNEIFRVLANNGTFLFSVPFAYDNYEYKERAVMLHSGEIQHYEEPEYHGNPVDPENGALCYRYFGWEMLDILRKIGFVNVRAIAYWSIEQGYLGREQFLFMAHKK